MRQVLAYRRRLASRLDAVPRQIADQESERDRTSNEEKIKEKTCFASAGTRLQSTKPQRTLR